MSQVCKYSSMYARSHLSILSWARETKKCRAEVEVKSCCCCCCTVCASPHWRLYKPCCVCQLVNGHNTSGAGKVDKSLWCKALVPQLKIFKEKACKLKARVEVSSLVVTPADLNLAACQRDSHIHTWLPILAEMDFGDTVAWEKTLVCSAVLFMTMIKYEQIPHEFPAAMRHRDSLCLHSVKMTASNPSNHFTVKICVSPDTSSMMHANVSFLTLRIQKINLAFSLHHKCRPACVTQQGFKGNKHWVTSGDKLTDSLL